VYHRWAGVLPKERRIKIIEEGGVLGEEQKTLQYKNITHSILLYYPSLLQMLMTGGEGF